jgi:hypothetical protein
MAFSRFFKIVQNIRPTVKNYEFHYKTGKIRKVMKIKVLLLKNMLTRIILHIIK